MKIYPLGETNPDFIKGYSGKSLDEINIEAVMSGDVKETDIRISRKVLLLQAEVARQAGRIQLAKSFVRSAELIDIPDDRILEIYNMLRPNRSTEAELDALVKELEQVYEAEMCAELVRETRNVYKDRGILKNT